MYCKFILSLNKLLDTFGAHHLANAQLFLLYTTIFCLQKYKKKWSEMVAKLCLFIFPLNVSR